MNDAERAERERTERQATIERVEEVGKVINKLEQIPTNSWETAPSRHEPYLRAKLDDFDIQVAGINGLDDHSIRISSKGLTIAVYSTDQRIEEFYKRTYSGVLRYKTQQEKSREAIQAQQRTDGKARFLKMLGIES